MASGPTGTGWTDLATLLNGQFLPANRRAFAARFKTKHGKDGQGRDPGTTAYKFGQFVDRHGGFLSGSALGQFLIDSGRRHWDGPALDLLEYTIRHSLTHQDAAGADDPKGIKFEIVNASPGTLQATAEIRDANDLTKVLRTPAQVDAALAYEIKISCPPPNPRP